MVGMKLADKGRYKPPPRLPRPAQEVSEAVASWPNVQARTHWLLGDEREVDGADFYVGDTELGHIHLDSEAHVVLPSKVATVLIKAKHGRSLPWSRSAVVFPITTAKDVEHALWLFRLSYDRRLGTLTGELLDRVSRYHRTAAAKQHVSGEQS
jgi:hypothetical protein